jgi:hypothetical protein
VLDNKPIEEMRKFIYVGNLLSQEEREFWKENKNTLNVYT